MSTFKIIANPAAGRGRAGAVAARVERILRERKVPYHLEFTRGPGEAGRIAREALASYDTVVALGGDGTIHEVAQGMAFSETPLAVVPGGSGNDFCKSLKIPPRTEDALDVLLGRNCRKTDLGQIDERYFVNGVGIGFDAAVAAEAAKAKRLTGVAAYFVAMLRMLKRYEPIDLTIRIDEDVLRQKAFLMAIGNGSVCGGGFRLTPRALIDDAVLDVTILDPLSTAALLWHLPKVFAGTIEKVKYVSMRRGKELAVEGREPLPIHIDGEVYSAPSRSHRIRVHPGALCVVRGD